MKIYWTQKEFQYYHKNTKRMINCKNKIPFIIDWNGKLIIEINQYLLFKTETIWNPESKSPITNAQHLLSLLDYCYINDIPWKKLSSGELKQFIAYLAKNKQLKSSTIKQKIISIENLYLWLNKNYSDIHNPFNDFGFKTIEAVIKTFSQNSQHQKFDVNRVKDIVSKGLSINDIPTKIEIKDVYDFLNAENKLKMLFLIETGMRKNEMFQLTVDMINNMTLSKSGLSYSLILNANKINIKYSKTREIIVSENLRMQLIKHIISKRSKELQLKYMLKHNIESIGKSPLFISYQGNYFSEDSFNKTLFSASKKAKLESVITPHNLRHFYASHFIDSKDNKDWNMEQVYMYLAERLGHSSPDTTKAFYVKIINKIKLQEKIEKASDQFITEFLKD
jgi:integrase